MKANLNSNKKIWIAALLVLVLMISGSAAMARIDATPQQRQQLKTIAMQTRDTTRQKRDALRHARAELFKVYGDYNLDAHKAKVAIENIGKVQLDLLNLHLDNQIAIRNILNEDQFGQFVEMMRSNIHRGPGFHAFCMQEESPADMAPSKQLLDDIGVSQDQIRRIKGQLGSGQKKKVVLDKLRHDSAQLLDTYSKYNLDKAAAKKLIDNVHNYQVELSAVNFKRQQVIRSVLTQDQFQKLQQKLAERMHSMRHQWQEK